MKHFIYFSALLASITLAATTATTATASTSTEPTTIKSLLKELDKAIEDRPLYDQVKKQRIEELKNQLTKAQDDDERFALWGQLLEEYRSYNTDLAMEAAIERETIALRLNKKDEINNARLNRADVMGTVGMYKEAMDLIEPIKTSDLPDYLHSYYYHICRTIYGLMADYAITDPDRELYGEYTDRYRDSLMLVNQGDKLMQALIGADQLNVHGQYEEAILLLTDYLSEDVENEHNVAICAYTLSESYRLLGDTGKEKEYLIISAIADMQTAVLEYVSLRKLAVLIYQDGDIDRAYNYLKLCMEDAAACNARLRKLEILEIFPIINDAYQLKTKKQKEQMKWVLIAISILALALIVAVSYVYKQMRRVSAARHEVVDANNRLKLMNEELKQYIRQLDQANRSIAENSQIKETYIGRYMDQCSVYIEKMDNYRRSLNRIAKQGKVEDLYKKLKSTKLIDDELKEFYANFDSTFLQLFPNFVEDFNALLREDEQICPKAGERLNAELRIFALIRLGIKDSAKISQFLRYSLSTIYNYRTKVRNKAKGDRDKLEQQLMEIGR